MDQTLLEASRLVHAVLGSVALFAGVVAMLTVKGSRLHVRAGRVFAWLMGAVVVLALLFMFYRFLPLAVVLSLATAYMIPSAVLSTSRNGRGFVGMNVLLMGVTGGLCLFATDQFVRLNLGADQLFIGPLVLAALFGALFADDWRMLVRRPVEPNYWIRRHLERMILAFAIAVMALVRIGVDFGLTFEMTVILPLSVAAFGILYMYRRYPLAGRTKVAEVLVE
ncbi:MAG: hypothetical protein WD081_02975 [Gammaproteobacteria bacterium]